MSARGLAFALLVTLPWGAKGRVATSWKEIAYLGHTRYTVRTEAGVGVLHAESRAQHSALVTALELDPRGVWLRWRWRILEHPRGADPTVRSRDDRAAAVIVLVRRSLLPWRTRALLYQWSAARPAGEWGRSPYSGEVRTLVLENAPADSGWRSESRDLGADLESAFGRIPKRIEAVGVLCDTDNTRGHAVAEFEPLEADRSWKQP